MKKMRIFQVLVITVSCAAVFAGVRSIPVAQCGFLHYEEVVLENGDVELCATNEAGFVNLEKLKPPLSLKLLGVKGARAGQEIQATMRLQMDSGDSLYAQDLAITHTEKLHVLIISQNLEDYHHVHPQPIAGSDLWEFQWTPAQGGQYHIFADLVPVRTRRQVMARAVVNVEGEDAPGQWDLSPSKNEGSLAFELSGKSDQWLTKLNQDVTLTVSNTEGETVRLEEIMGAYAHIVAFDENLQGVGHMHPIPNGKENLAQPVLDFSFYTQEPGRYRLWAHLQWDGEERFVPFDLVVN